MLQLAKLPLVIWHLCRNGIIGHCCHKSIFPPWLRRTLYCLDFLLASRKPKKPGLALADALITLGPGFVKLGQALSCRPDILGADVACDLTMLQDNLKPFPLPIVETTLKKAYGKPLAEVFAHFDAKPIAAASIAQVHFARLHDGREVAVKILRPRIRSKLAKDIRFFRFLARLLEFLAPSLRRLKLSQAVTQFEHGTKIELNLTLEAAAAEKLRKNHANDKGIYIPFIDWSLTTDNVLVMERIDGIRIDDDENLSAEGYDIDSVIATASKSFFHQVFRDGFFHADLHPGNLFICKNGILVPIDFGIMGHLSFNDRFFLAQLLIALLDGDFDEVAKLHAKAGMLGDDVDLQEFSLAIQAVTAPIFNQPLGQVSLAMLLGQIFSLSRLYHIEVQPQFTLLQKNMVMAEGIIRQLNPHANMWPMARELAMEWIENQDNTIGNIDTVTDKIRDFGQRLPLILTRVEGILSEFDAISKKIKQQQSQKRPKLSFLIWTFLWGGILWTLTIVLIIVATT